MERWVCSGCGGRFEAMHVVGDVPLKGLSDARRPACPSCGAPGMLERAHESGRDDSEIREALLERDDDRHAVTHGRSFDDHMRAAEALVEGWLE